MRRLRLLFVAFAVALLAPLGFLVHRALDSVALERAMRHQAVAERIFDEMERELSRLLDVEEERPFESWGARVSEFPFVVGYFQLDPGRRVRVLSVRPELPNASADVERLAAGHWRAAPPGTEVPHAAGAQRPGTTLELEEGKRLDRGAARLEPLQAAGRAGEVSAFDALRSLNKAVEERVARQRKAAEYGAKEETDSPLPRNSRVARLAARPADERPAPEPGQQERGTALDEADVPPLRGRVVDDNHLLLRRTVVRNSARYAQGMVIDVGRLGAWLQARGLGSDGLAEYADLSFSTRLAAPSPTGAPTVFVYQHRFAEPFDGLSARLALAPLPGVGSVAYVYVLCALLLAVGSLGLAALYRMVAVAVSFAERRNNFVAAVTHELKTPLTAIRMYGEMLRDGIVPSEEKRAEYHRHITQESERLSRLINNVLEFSRLENGKRDVALVAGPVAPVVREVAEILRPHVEGEGFALHVETEDGLPAVRFERDALVQVLCNLVDNAVKYSADAAQREIVLACRKHDGRVVVAVRDHGPGVASRHLGRIFDPFYRGESELTRRSKGVGLGLALVRGLAAKMGARVSGRNAPGGGFEVEVLFIADCGSRIAD
jgi:signal transduction histidine kinase